MGKSAWVSQWVKVLISRKGMQERGSGPAIVGFEDGEEGP